MKIIELIDERGASRFANALQIAELEPVGKDKVRVYMATHTCHVHGCVFHTTIRELAAAASAKVPTSGVIQTAAAKAAEEKRVAEAEALEKQLADAEDALAAKIATL